MDSQTFSLNNILGNSNFDFISALNNSDPDNNNLNFQDSPYDTTSINCSYIDESELIANRKQCKDFSMLSINIQSLPAKFTEFSQFISILNASNAAPDVICLQELWNFPLDASFKLNGYHPLVYTLRHNNVQGGGIGIYVKSKFSFTVLPEHSVFMDRILETIVIEITVNPSSKIYIASMYRPGSSHPTLSPANHFQQFLELFSNFCSSLISLGTVYCTS